NTVLDEIVYEFGTSEEQARKYLGAFLFHGDDVYRTIGELSGGEQSRVAFLKLMLTGANFLILDEPTNHLDIPAKEAVEEALMAFPGTFLVVSHDRYFLDKISNCTLELVDGKLTEYNGNYSYYRMKKAMEEQEAAEAQEKQPVGQAAKAAAQREPEAECSDEARQEKMRQAQERRELAERSQLRNMSDEKRQELLDRAEAEIAMAEAERKGLEHQMNQPEVQMDPERSRSIAEAYAAKETELRARYEKWEKLAE
ncbi:MAG: ABC-F family ATP-binding cassette domain-containing protein, partial [Selenomonadaceae bacterium]|nr:ABC-F family ATP-binding cassette domain-containing protein [Selenomonadaceae bacterium]